MTYSMSSVAGVLAFPVFWGALFFFGALNPGYSHFHQAVSELGAFGAPNALMWNLIGFIIPGILLAVCGAGVALRIDGRRTSLYWLLLLSGLGFSGTGTLPAEMYEGSPLMDSAWTSGHIVMTIASGLPWVIATIILVLHVKRNPHWSNLITICSILSICSVASFFLNVAASSLPYLSENPGLAQRIAFAIYFAWFLIMGLLFIKNTSELKEKLDNK